MINLSGISKKKDDMPTKFLLAITTTVQHGRCEVLSLVMPLPIMRPGKCFATTFTGEPFSDSACSRGRGRVRKRNEPRTWVRTP